MSKSSTQPRTVLLVDDDPSQLKLYSWIVGRGGYRPVTALVGSSSVAFPRDRQIDVAVMDYRLSSELTARDVARHLRMEYPNVPIVLLSEMLWMPDEMKGVVDRFVSKGEPERLLELLAELVEADQEAKPDEDRKLTG
jgi:CheY-like chemotaxis protein